MSCQSVTATPANPSSVRRTSVRRALDAWAGTPLMLAELIIVVGAPAATAAAKAGWKYCLR
jgi:hypothetical protein